MSAKQPPSGIPTIYALRPSDFGSGSLFDYDLAYQDLEEERRDSERNGGGVSVAGPYGVAGPGGVARLKELAKAIDTPSEAIAEYKEALRNYRATGSTANKNVLDAAVQKMSDLGVTREQLESAGLYGGIIEGPTLGESLGTAVERASELFGLGAEGLAKLVGADEALSGVFAHVPTPGVTFVFDQKGQPPFVTGQTPTGTQVGITDPYGITAILEGLRQGDFGIYDAAGVLGAGVGGATSIAKAVQDEDAARVGTETGVVLDIEGGVPSDIAGTGDVTRTSLPDADTQITRTSLPDADTQITRTSLPDADTQITRTSLPDAELDAILEDLGGRPAVPGGYDEIVTGGGDSEVTEIVTGGGDGGGGGGVGLGETGITPTGGIRGVATEKAGVADIAMLYDPSLSFAENMALMLGKKKPEQADAVDSALMYGGGIVQPIDLNEEILRILEGR